MPEDGHSRWRDRLGHLGEAAGRILRLAASEGGRAADRAKGAVSRVGSGVHEIATDTLDTAWTTVHRAVVEDENAILDQCPVVSGLLGHRETFERDPQSFGALYNLRVRPVVTGALLSASGGAALAGSFDEQLARLTRHVFDGDILLGGRLADAVASAVGPDTARAVNEFMDRVPRSTVMGGGWIHRIQHGHDLAAVAEIYGDHGYGGAAQALYHIFGRDFFTPAGIPVLPAGSDQVHRYLVSELGLGKQQAADLISLHAVELLAGVATVAGLVRLWRIARAVRDNSRVAKMSRQALDAIEHDDAITAVGLAEEARAIRPEDSSLVFLAANIHHRAGRTLHAHLSFQEIVRRPGAQAPVHDLGGAPVALRGLAAVGALATSHALARDDEYKEFWREHVIQLARAGVRSFEALADSLVDRRFVRRRGERGLLPARHLSAAINYWLAGHTAGAALFLPERDTVLARAERKIDECLAEVEKRPTVRKRVHDVRFLRQFTRAQLAPLAGATA